MDHAVHVGDRLGDGGGVLDVTEEHLRRVGGGVGGQVPVEDDLLMAPGGEFRADRPCR